MRHALSLAGAVAWLVNYISGDTYRSGSFRVNCNALRATDGPFHSPIAAGKFAVVKAVRVDCEIVYLPGATSDRWSCEFFDASDLVSVSLGDFKLGTHQSLCVDFFLEIHYNFMATKFYECHGSYCHGQHMKIKLWWRVTFLKFGFLVP